MAKKDINKLDLYKILGVQEEASEKEILKGYRKKALKCHPDKNPDNPKAAEEFHELSKALEILTDAAARAAYDQSRKAKKAAEARTRVLDSKRKKFKEDLEAREQAAFEQTQRAAELQAEKKLQAEIERLRKEGSRLLEQEQERLRQELKKSSQLADNAEAEDEVSGETPRVKLKWKAAKGDLANGGYNKENLTNLLSCYGSINALIVSSKRNGSAIVEFDSSGVSSDIADEKGLVENPFTMTWLSGKPSQNSSPYQSFYNTETNSGVEFNGSGNGTQSHSHGTVPQSSQGVQGAQPTSSSSAGNDDDQRDFESLVLRKMRQAEERKKLMEQMMKEDGEGV